MIKEYANIFRRTMIVLDAIILTAIFIFCYWQRAQVTIGYGLPDLDFCIRLCPVIVFFWIGTLHYLGMYYSFRLKSAQNILLTIFKSAMIAFVLFGSILYFLKITNISRVFIVMVFGLTTLAFSIEKIALLLFFKEIRRRGFNFKNILVVGTNSRAGGFIKTLNLHRDLGLKVVGVLDEDANMVGKKIAEHEVIGTLNDLEGVLEHQAIDHVIVIASRSSLNKVEPLIHHCETVGTTVSVAVDLFNPQVSVARGESILGMPVLTFQTVSNKVGQLICKRLLDTVVSGLFLLLTLPINLIVAVLIKATSKGPVFFAQDRCGLAGRTFKLYKFRTMCIDAEERLAALKEQNEMQGPAFKIANDPRIIPIGKFLRKWSLDELPQLWNIFLGEMSLVGPRPPMPREVEQYDCWQRRRLSMRPGLTGLWQVSGRNNISKFDEWVKLDLKYLDQWSLKEDFKILLRTVPAVLKSSGAR
ncbi:MAG: sugar transferase [Candidatus Omnitrophica bacterium]|nr:sugar transferase [Candidatus Omnitrophota bacterium]